MRRQAHLTAYAAYAEMRATVVRIWGEHPKPSKKVRRIARVRPFLPIGMRNQPVEMLP